MSLILEALRKSEAERRRGQAPDLLADMPPAQPAARRRPTGWLWLSPLLAVLLLLAWWLPHRQPPVPEAARPAPRPQATATHGPPPATALPAVERLTPQAPVVQPRPAPAVSPPKAPARATDTPRNAPGETTRMPATPADIAPPRASPNPAARPTLLPPSPGSVETTQSAPPSPDGTGGTGVASLSDLSTSERESLPPLKISMHLWNADPARRFVILDGNRVVEGDRVGDAVVKTITPDGVVIDWRGQRIKLPIR